MSDTQRGSHGRSLCLTPELSGMGGTASFQFKLMRALEARGIQVTFSLDQPGVERVLRVGGTRDLLGLWKARRSGLPVYQRLDGMNWIHKKRRTGLRHYLKAERANLLLSWIRSHIATGVIYQSHFVHAWWERVYGPTSVQHTMIYNGVDLGRYNPQGSRDRPRDSVRVLVVEGRLAGGYEIGLEHALGFTRALAELHPRPIELMVVGEVSEDVRRTARARSSVPIHWVGSVSREQIPHLDRSAYLLFAADIHPACPNAVIEAIACGLPVVGFDTGALAEIIQDEAGCIVPYGSDAWNLEQPDFKSLALAAHSVLQDIERYRKGARARAVEMFDVEQMATRYLEAIGW